MTIYNHIKSLVYLTFFFFACFSFGQSGQKKFTVVLDAGHGGHDSGAKYHGFIEKDIALNTTLKVGEFLENYKDVKVIFTRKTDVFIELRDRPDVANKAHANLFISIHCNGVTNNSAEGTETFVMGLARSKMNLEVAKKENSVILLEDNYKVKYKNFNPNNPESIMGMKVIVEENLSSSISLASKIEDNFTAKLERKSRGVKQQPLWVLDASTMPGVLIELGFLSNQEEGAFLNSEEGQTFMAQQIANAILSYKKENFDESEQVEDNYEPENPKNDSPKVKDNVIQKSEPLKSSDTKANNSGTKFKIQLCASNKKLDLLPKNFKGMNDISMEKSGGLYKYFAGNESDTEEIKSILKTAKAKGYKSAFIVTFVDGKKR